MRSPSNLDELLALRAQRDSVTSHEVVEAAGQRVPVRLFRPAGPPRAVHLDLHGGGFYLGPTARENARNQQLADALGFAIVSVDYRIAPEDPWPAAPDDCETAARWLIEHAGSRFGTTRLTIGGFSAGSTLAMTTLMRLRGLNAFDRAVLQFGTYDLSGLTPAGRLIADEYFLEAYVGHVADRTVADISPIYGDLGGLPPLLMVVGGADVLLDDNQAMAARVRAAGGDVDLRIYPEAPHAFTNQDTEQAKAARHDIECWLTKAVS